MRSQVRILPGAFTISTIKTDLQMTKQGLKTKLAGVPRGAVATVVVGVIASVMAVAIDFVTEDGGGSAESTTWLTVQRVEAPPLKDFGDGGQFGLARTTLSAIEPVESGELLFRVAGLVEVDAGPGPGPVTVRCDVKSPAEGSFIARTPQRRASWPRPADDLGAQPVPEELVVKFRQAGKTILGLPVRDAFRSFTDSARPASVGWISFVDQTQNFAWKMPEGTGKGGATLAYAVVFKTTERPRFITECSGSSPESRQSATIEASQKQWPLGELAAGTDTP